MLPGFRAGDVIILHCGVRGVNFPFFQLRSVGCATHVNYVGSAVYGKFCVGKKNARKDPKGALLASKCQLIRTLT